MSTAPDPTAAADDGVQPPRPPFIRRVRIRNYKSIAFCDVTLEPLTILVGRNASGKSNFLDALGFLSDVIHVGIGEAVKQHGGAAAILCKWGSYPVGEYRAVSIEIEGEFTVGLKNDTHTSRYRLDIEFPRNRPPRVRAEVLRIEAGDWWVGFTNKGGEVIYVSADDEPLLELWHVPDRPALDSYRDSPVTDFIGYFDAFAFYRFNPEAIRPVRKPAPGYFLEPDGGNLASVIATTLENDPPSIERVRQFLTAITSSVGLVGVARYGDYETVRFSTIGADGRTAEFDAASMSDGTLRALAALVACYQLVVPQGHPTFIGIEEPETALHPAAMRALVSALDEATLRTQVLLTTHSPDLLDAEEVMPANVRVVRMIDGKTVIGPVDAADIEIVERELNTLAGLERQDRLDPDLDDIERQQRLAEEPRGAGE
ncbi:MAG TPA: AAA family ATPase [Urbifossiella sp.]|nr:AAA family ATPase [Urbifossiella sp.]